ncbi:MAG: LytR C-terminal domain-containing protein [Acidimicrobiia bacterium]|nr:LytR C-terminal domain-containing protein [Acidimicrobiia bacterium]
MGNHAAPGVGRFTRELASFGLRLAVVAVLFFGAVWLAVTYIPDLMGDGTDDPSAQPAGGESTSTSDTSSTSVLDVTIFSTLPELPTTTTVPVTTTTVPAERAAADVVVVVLNSTGQSGLAASATQVLAGLGYQTLEPDNSTPRLEASQILFAPGFAAEAYTLAAQFPDGQVAAEPSSDLLADIVVILGTEYVP